MKYKHTATHTNNVGKARIGAQTFAVTLIGEQGTKLLRSLEKRGLRGEARVQV